VTDGPDVQQFMPPREVAALLGVTTQTVGRWAEAGRIPSVRLPSGHRRYAAADVHALVEASTTTP
jgi:excisionase family DNA binding protein